MKTVELPKKPRVPVPDYTVVPDKRVRNDDRFHKELCDVLVNGTRTLAIGFIFDDGKCWNVGPIALPGRPRRFKKGLVATASWPEAKRILGLPKNPHALAGTYGVWYLEDGRVVLASPYYG